MAVKRLNIELPIDQHDFLKQEATRRGSSVSAVLRELIESHRQRRKRKKKGATMDDPLFKMSGAFDGPEDLAIHHDRYLYGKS